jgi:Integrase core domain
MDLRRHEKADPRRQSLQRLRRLRDHRRNVDVPRIKHRRPAHYNPVRKPAALRRPLELGQYVSLVFGQRCREAGIAQSMGSKGDCDDNAVKESFFASLEKDLLRRRSFRTRQEARTEVFDYIEVFYNRERLHSTLGYRSPEEYEQDYYERGDCERKEESIFIEEERKAA